MNEPNLNKIEDKVIKCCDCGQEFIWSRGEQLYYKSKKLSPVKRCCDCRQARKASLIPDEGVNE